MKGYEVTVEKSTKELSAKERLSVKDTTNATSLDTATQSGKLVIEPDFVVTLAVHNEKSEDKDYKKYVVVDKAGNKFVTGSESFITALEDIMNEMAGEAESYAVEIYRMPSKNYKGKEFITCSVV